MTGGCLAVVGIGLAICWPAGDGVAAACPGALLGAAVDGVLLAEVGAAVVNAASGGVRTGDGTRFESDVDADDEATELADAVLALRLPAAARRLRTAIWRCCKCGCFCRQLGHTHSMPCFSISVPMPFVTLTHLP